MMPMAQAVSTLSSTDRRRRCSGSMRIMPVKVMCRRWWAATRLAAALVSTAAASR